MKNLAHSASLQPLEKIAPSNPGIKHLVVVLGLAANYATLKPRYRLADQVPDQQNAMKASHQIDAKLTGANPVDVFIEFPSGSSLYSADALNVLSQVL